MPNNNLQFRIATPDDAAQIQALVEAAFRAEDSRPDWTADMKLGSSFRIGVETILSQITKPDSAILMATDDGALVGSVEVSKRDDLARISMLAVDLRHQRGGLGRRVLAHAEDYCQRTWGVHRIGLNALSTREQLISWYMRRGYQKTGETSPFPKERLGELELSDDLHFVELEKLVVNS
ncbi:putative N-acetyltransferase, GNAT family [Dactylonectria macrodidyma]|uniref:N-acetyltransferase, GNAT family n=1 Tax=Dactylonectria macrodidyma TaxID=307937 RepID=A0A9P9FTC7_9HYPO|nr:putative N-acetyltransferase, GNAT family [Dactylonectria macrodidyma]